MTEDIKATRLSKAAREFNVGISTIVEFLHKKGFDLDPNPNTKLPHDAYVLLIKEYSTDISVKKESEKLCSSFSPKVQVNLYIIFFHTISFLKSEISFQILYSLLFKAIQNIFSPIPGFYNPGSASLAFACKVRIYVVKHLEPVDNPVKASIPELC